LHGGIGMSTEVEPTRAVKLYISYAPEDEGLKKQLLKHLSLLVRQGYIESWDNRQIRAGNKRDEEVLKHLDEADIILCLLSANFIQSDFCYSVEMRRALERQKLKEVQVVPIILRAVDWKGTPLGDLQVIPRDYNNRPIADRPNKDKVFRVVVQEIGRIVEIHRRKNS
jgi:TIR domain